MRLIINEGGPDLTKRYFRETPGRRRTHIPGRCRGSWSEQGALLFRDYLRAHKDDARAYAAPKHRPTEEYRDDRGSYTEGKASCIWEITVRAHRWHQRIGRQPDPRQNDTILVDCRLTLGSQRQWLQASPFPTVVKG